MSEKQGDILDALVEPFQRYTRVASFSGILLFAATVIALIWANSPLGSSYTEFFNYKLNLKLGTFIDLDKPLLLWINDGLMAIFFFVVGLEIKREIMFGELSTVKKASLPVFAAVGGMIIPALLFLSLHGDQPGKEGWGIPMATDIAFTIGVLSLLGKRVPLSMKIFLTAFAIVDDIGAVLVIAIFYSGHIDAGMLLAGLGLLVALYALGVLGLRNPVAYFIAGGIVWYLFLKTGLHPTIAGVLLAVVIPAKRKVRVPVFYRAMNRNLQEFCEENREDDLLLKNEQMAAVDKMEGLMKAVQSPLQTLEHNLHGFVSYFVMPVFALANAGVILGSGGGDPVIGKLSFDISLALFLGKLTGILGFSFLGVQLGLAALPDKARWVHIAALGLLGGIGFTMSLFISGLAFTELTLLNHAKIGILIGSLVSGLAGYFLLRYSLNKQA